MPDAQGNTLLTQTAPLGFHGGSRVGVTGLICTGDCLRENRSVFLDARCQGCPRCGAEWKACWQRTTDLISSVFASDSVGRRSLGSDFEL